MLSPRQNQRYRPLVAKAWLAVCERSGQNPADKGARENWYRKELLGAVGFYTTKGIQTDQEFDRICLHFATVSGDKDDIAYWSSADERRALWRLEQNMKRAGLDWPYVRGIARAMHLLDANHLDVADLPAEHIRKLSTAVFLYIKRKERAKSSQESSSRTPNVGGALRRADPAPIPEEEVVPF